MGKATLNDALLIMQKAALARCNLVTRLQNDDIVKSKINQTIA
jgi:hypothetical protein